MVKNLPFRFFLKLHGYPLIASAANYLGISWSKLGGKRYSVFTAIAQAKELVASTTFECDNKKSLDIIMLTMLGGHYFSINVEILLGIALKKRGHRVRYVIDDNKLPLNEHHLVGNEEEWGEVSAKDYAYGKKYLSSLGFEILPLSTLTKNGKKLNISRFNHIIESTLLKHYRVGVVDSNLKDLDYKRSLVEASINISARLGYEISEMRPDRVIMSHGIYSTWGPAREVLIDNNIPVITYGESKKKDTIRLNWTVSADVWDVGGEWEKLKDVKLTTSEESIIDEYLESRISHKNDVMIYNFGSYENKEETYNKFNIDPDKPVYSLFTNVLWDAASAQKELVFENPIDWCLKTIEWFIMHPEKQLIVKIHPAEIVIGTKQPFANIVKTHFPTIPNNITIIEPQEKVNSWSIYNITDLGLVHTSTPGIELPLLGIPCAVVSDVYYRNRGFTIDVENSNDYFQLLDNFQPGLIDDKELITLSKRFAHLIFEKYSIDFPFIRSLHSLNNVVGWKIDDTDDFLAHKSTKFILDAIEAKTSFCIL